MPEYLSLDDNGHLAPEGELGRRWLAAKAGRWRIVPASPDLLLLRRQRADAKAEGVRAVMTADLQGVALGELLAFFAQSRWTGVLTVASGPVEKSVFIKQGAMRWAASNQLTDRLGEVVRRLGMVEGADVDRILAQDPSGHRVGQLLVQEGLLDAPSLYQALKNQIEEIFFSVLVMDRGLMFLFNDPVEARFAAQINMDLNGLLMDGLRRIDEFGHFRKRIPGLEAYVCRRDREPAGLNAEEQRVFDLVNGKRTVGELAAEAHLSEFDATKILFGLAEAGYVEVSEEKPTAVLGGNVRDIRPEVHEVLRVFNTIFREIQAEVARIAPTAGFRLGAETFLASDQHGFSELFRGLSLSEEGTLPEGPLLDNLGSLGSEQAPDPTRYLYDALNEFMFFELFQAGELLTPDRDEDLSRRVKTIYELLGQ